MTKYSIKLSREYSNGRLLYWAEAEGMPDGEWTGACSEDSEEIALERLKVKLTKTVSDSRIIQIEV